MNNAHMGRNHQILLLERDTSVRELMNEVLVEADYQVLKHEYSLEPADVSNLQPDLIVLDMPKSATSPELDFVSHLKSDARTAHIPIVVICKSYPSKDVPAWTQQHGIAGLHLKPFDLDDFLATVQSAIGSANIAALTAQHESSVHHMDRGTVHSPAQGPAAQG